MHRSASLGVLAAGPLTAPDARFIWSCHAAHPPTRGWHAMFCEAVLGLEMVCLCWGEGETFRGVPRHMSGSTLAVPVRVERGGPVVSSPT